MAIFNSYVSLPEGIPNKNISMMSPYPHAHRPPVPLAVPTAPCHHQRRSAAGPWNRNVHTDHITRGNSNVVRYIYIVIIYIYILLLYIYIVII